MLIVDSLNDVDPLKRKYSFPSFEEAIAFIDRVAPILVAGKPSPPNHQLLHCS